MPLSEFFPVPEFVRDWLQGMDLPYSGFEAGGEPGAWAVLAAFLAFEALLFWWTRPIKEADA